MTNTEILELIKKKIKGQGNQIDSGSTLAEILNAIIGNLTSGGTIEKIETAPPATITLKKNTIISYTVAATRTLTLVMPTDYDENVNDEYIVDILMDSTARTINVPTGIKKIASFTATANKTNRVTIKGGCATMQAFS